MRVEIFALSAVLFAAQAADDTLIRAAAGRSVRLLQSSMGQWKQDCTSCHHQTLPLMALDSARRHGIPVDEPAAQVVVNKVFGDYLSSVDNVARFHYIGDPGPVEGYLLTVAATYGVPPSLTTRISAQRLASMQTSEGNWRLLDARPPHSASVFMSTALAARGVAVYAPGRRQSIERARQWLASTKPESAEDHAFRLLGLLWTGAAHESRAAAAKDALAHQRSDGGWGQHPGLESDAYSTGEIVYALRESAGLTNEKGLAYLLRTQKPDGSWLVETRLHTVAPVSPPFFETGFPYGRNQFLSCAATAWAVMALAGTLPAHNVPPLDVSAAAPKGLQPWMESLDDPKAATPAGTTALMLSAGDPAKVRSLLAKGADVHARTKTGYDALMAASQYPGNLESVRLLLAKGASPAPRKGVLFNMSALFFAAHGGDAGIVELLLQHRASHADRSILFGFYPVRPLEVASQFQHTSVVRALARHGAPVDSLDDNRMSSLSLAALHHKDDSLRALLELGANPSHVDKYGYTPIQHTPGIRHSSSAAADMLKAALARSGPH